MTNHVYPITSITQGPRQSNIELLRIMAMFLVLVVHSDFWSLGKPDATDFVSNPQNAILRTIIESISIVCVNVFILISGWFGIKFTKKGFANFIFQCAFFLFGIYGVMLICGKTELSLKGIAGCLCLTNANWFIRAYVGLYILAPILNIYRQYTTEKLQSYILILFFGFQTIYGWTNAAKFIELGYSTFSFIGLYLLAGYIRDHHISIIYRFGGLVYIICMIINTGLYYLITILHIPIETYAYINPFVILGALGLLVFFAQLSIKSNKYINYIAKSSFAVFLFHTNPNIGVPVFKSTIINLYKTYSGGECLGIILIFLISVFVLSILLDQPRKYIWSKLSKIIFK